MSIPGYDRWKLRSDRDDAPEEPPARDRTPEEERLVCEEHPNARVRAVYDADFYVLNRVEVSRVPFRKRLVRYECAECGKVLET